MPSFIGIAKPNQPVELTSSFVIDTVSEHAKIHLGSKFVRFFTGVKQVDINTFLKLRLIDDYEKPLNIILTKLVGYAFDQNSKGGISSKGADEHNELQEFVLNKLLSWLELPPCLNILGEDVNFPKLSVFLVAINNKFPLEINNINTPTQ